MNWLIRLNEASPRTARRFLTICALLGLAWGGTGCAVTEIDVDVYKGPLANDPDIQVEQTIAMAMGAKPLLVQLRDSLEWDEKGFAIGGGETKSQAMLRGAYRPSYMPQPYDDGNVDPLKCHAFAQSRARQVNEVLSLYNDMPAGDVSAQRINKLWQQFRAKLDILNSGAQDLERWRAFSAEMRDDPGGDLLRTLNGSATNTESLSFAEVQLAGLALKNAYQGFLAPNSDQLRGKEVFMAHARLRKALQHAGVVVPGTILVASEALAPANGKTDQISANLYFDGLREATTLKSDAGILFKPGSVHVDEFTHAVTEIADAFAGSRDDLASLFDFSTELLAEGKDIKPERINSAAKLVSELIQPFYLWAALHNQALPKNPAEVASLNDLRNVVLRRLPASFEDYHEWSDSRMNRQAIQHAVREAIINEPSKTAQALRLANFTLAQNFLAPAALKSEFKPLEVERAWTRYGLVRGPGPKDALEELLGVRLSTPASAPIKNLRKAASNESLTGALWHLAKAVTDYATDAPAPSEPGLGAAERQTVEQVEASVEEYVQIGGALGGGRDWRGIETLTTAYVQRLNRNPIAGNQAIMPRVQLLEELTRFAEKLLVAANYEQLLADRPARAATWTGTSKATDTKAFNFILQAIGNSILVQADEIRHDTRWKRNEEGLWKLEANAAQSSFETPQQTPAGPRSALTPSIHAVTEKPTPTIDPTQPYGPPRTAVLDQLIAKLRYQYLQKTTGAGADKAAAEQIQQAMNYLYAQRADMVYIRPPVTFLRNSYPVTTLQQDAQMRWSNMLAQEAENSMPFAELVRDSLDRQGAENARIAGGIDKTFWQNINRVRVAGTGRTNQVIVKDDVGNWYVKGYSADPEDVIKGVQQMATFAVGAPVNSKAIQDTVAKLQKQKGQSPSQSSQATTQPDAAQAANNALRQKQYEQAKNEYDSSFKRVAQEIDASVRNINAQIESVLTQKKLRNDSLFASADQCAKEHLTGPATQPASFESGAKPTIEDAAYAELHAIKAYGIDLRTRFTQAGRPSAADTPTTTPATAPANVSALTDQQIAQALNCATQITRTTLDNLIQSETAVFERYTAQLQLISESDNPVASAKP